MQKIRINDLARELEVKSKMILDALIKVGVTEKKTHSSSIEVDEAERVKKYFAEHAEAGSSRASSRASAEEFKPKLDLSHISKPGDVLKAITQRAAQPSAVARPATASAARWAATDHRAAVSRAARIAGCEARHASGEYHTGNPGGTAQAGASLYYASVGRAAASRHRHPTEAAGSGASGCATTSAFIVYGCDSSAFRASNRGPDNGTRGK